MIAAEPYKDEMVPLGRLGQPEDIAEAVVFLSSQASHFITGQVLDVNGGMLMI
jgi:NAD(P)-dependent dehydrogenase (short-subunit alcohol dehydrogenase family)